jgi:hypothetical protein
MDVSLKTLEEALAVRRQIDFSKNAFRPFCQALAHGLQPEEGNVKCRRLPGRSLPPPPERDGLGSRLAKKQQLLGSATHGRLRVDD